MKRSTLILGAGAALSSGCQTEGQGRKREATRRQSAPSCVVCAAANLHLCLCGTVTERFCLSLRSSAGWRIMEYSIVQYTASCSDRHSNQSYLHPSPLCSGSTVSWCICMPGASRTEQQHRTATKTIPGVRGGASFTNSLDRDEEEEEKE